MDDPPMRQFNHKLGTFATGFLWFVVLFELVTSARRGRLGRAEVWYWEIIMVAAAWIGSTSWAGTRQGAAANPGDRFRRALRRVGDWYEPFVTGINRRLFLWTPLLCAVFWSLFGSRLGYDRAHQIPLPELQATMYFMVAMLWTNILLKGILDLRRPASPGH
jgi:hypothetical protein